mmetsp:Transcript_4958/g.12030  ORF Transcript_4958/g.12030 Transcript_4958/m.12030 type:complete len:389 (+) Transcript_4958:90-1256(+)
MNSSIMEAATQRMWTSSELAELLGSSLDCVIEHSGLCREDVYLWVKGALPVSIWQKLWKTTALGTSTASNFKDDDEGNVAIELPLREDAVLMKSDLATLAATRSLVGASAVDRSVAGSKASKQRHRKSASSAGRAIESRSYVSAPARSCDVSGLPGEEQSARKGTLAEFFQTRRNSAHMDTSASVVSEGQPSSPRQTSRQVMTRETDSWQAGTWASAVTMLPANAQGYSADIQPLADCLDDSFDVLNGSKLSFPDETPVARKGRGDNESSVKSAMSAWLDTPTTFQPILTPLQVADWLRTLPPSKVSKETKKSLARHVLQYKIDGEDFQAMLNEGRWAELGLQDERESVTFLRLFKQGQHEVAMTEAVRQAARSNSSRKKLKGEMLVA